jgi:phosphoribosylformimino-5-aminoimidazole carboxamide ribotide isomerase
MPHLPETNANTPRSNFRPCIDLHQGRVKQIVGGSLTANDQPDTNFESELGAEVFAARYRTDRLKGGHVIMLGPNNEQAAKAALAAYPGGLQVGGGITPENADTWLDGGASHVIVTSYLFDNGIFQPERLDAMTRAIGKARLVLDLSCRRTDAGWSCASDRWQTVTDLPVNTATLDALAGTCDEFLIHAADVEGKCGGIDRELVALLGSWHGCPVTYAGGARGLEDLRRVNQLSQGRVDLTIGSALDIFGGTGITYEACLDWNHNQIN